MAGTSTEPAGPASLVRKTIGWRCAEVARPNPQRPTPVVFADATEKNVLGPATGQRASLSMHVEARTEQSVAAARAETSAIAPTAARAGSRDRMRVGIAFRSGRSPRPVSHAQPLEKQGKGSLLRHAAVDRSRRDPQGIDPRRPRFPEEGNSLQGH